MKKCVWKDSSEQFKGSVTPGNFVNCFSCDGMDLSCNSNPEKFKIETVRRNENGDLLECVGSKR